MAIKKNTYVFEFMDGPKFIIDGEPDYIKEISGYNGMFVIIKNKVQIDGYIRKVTIQ